MSFNPMDSVKNFINTSANKFAKSFNMSNLITPTVQKNEQIQLIQPEQQNSNHMSPFEKQFESAYVGCYTDDPSNPSMDNFLGYVSNISECINMGREKQFEYVGIREGNQCFASNTIPETQKVNRTQYCNAGCNDIGTGNCGGFFYNQVYKTTTQNDLLKDLQNIKQEIEKEINQKIEKDTKQEINALTSNAIDILENFISSDNDIKKITIGLNSDNFNCWKPLNTYIVFIWLIIFMILIYLLFEYLRKKNGEKLI